MANVELAATVEDQGRTASGVPITDELIDRLSTPVAPAFAASSSASAFGCVARTSDAAVK